jgi:CBS domain containing-hemolysin-like protein
MALALIAALALVLANGFFVATEFALARVRPTQIDDWERRGRPGARSVRHGVEHIDAYLAACQLGITLASLGLGVVGKPAFERLLEPLLGTNAAIASIGLAAGLAFFVITLLHVVVGELAPKSAAIARTQAVALVVAPPMRAFYLSTKPLVDLFNSMGNLLLKPFGIPPASEAGHVPHTESELLALLRESSEQGLIELGDQQLTDNVFAFGDRRVREIMRPRPEIHGLGLRSGVAEAVELSRATGHTRFPLCDDELGLDGATGVVHVKDLLTADPRPATLGLLARPLGRVSESMLLGELLRDLRRQRRHMALVVDEHGTTVGLVTLEDVLEELVGEIEDEFDAEEARLIARDGEVTLVEAQAPLRLLSEELGLEVAGHHEATIGGHVLERLGRMPAVGETVPLDGFVAEVVAVGEGRLERLRLLPRPPR